MEIHHFKYLDFASLAQYFIYTVLKWAISINIYGFAKLRSKELCSYLYTMIHICVSFINLWLLVEIIPCLFIQIHPLIWHNLTFNCSMLETLIMCFCTMFGPFFCHCLTLSPRYYEVSFYCLILPHPSFLPPTGKEQWEPLFCEVRYWWNSRFYVRL